MKWVHSSVSLLKACTSRAGSRPPRNLEGGGGASTGAAAEGRGGRGGSGAPARTLEQCEQAIREAQAGAERQARRDAADAQTPREQQRLLEGRLAGLRQAIAQQSRSLSSSDIGQPRKTLSAKLRGGAAARERAKLLESLAAEHDQSEDGSNIASARTSIEEWGQLTRRLAAAA